MWRTAWVAVRTYMVAVLILGLAYPLAVTGAAVVLFPRQSRGSLVARPDGTVVGSRLIGQRFESDAYFRGRPSVAGSGYDPLASGGSNLGPTSKVLSEQLSSRAGEIARETGAGKGSIPADMLTASASGLDPHISPANALAQVPRVARARGMREDELRAVVLSMVEGRDLGFLGEPRVNVLELNLALDGRAG